MEEIVITIKSGEEEEYISKHKGKDRLKSAIHFIKTDAIVILEDQNK